MNSSHQRRQSEVSNFEVKCLITAMLDSSGLRCTWLQRPQAHQPLKNALRLHCPRLMKSFVYYLDLSKNKLSLLTLHFCHESEESPDRQACDHVLMQTFSLCLVGLSGFFGTQSCTGGTNADLQAVNDLLNLRLHPKECCCSNA